MSSIKTTLFALLIMAVGAGLSATAQDMKEVKLLAVKPDFPKAKSAIDHVLAEPGNAGNAEAYFWKSYIYVKLDKDPKNQALCPDCKWEAFKAVQKYLELDPSMKETNRDSNALVYDIYASYYQDAVNAYNAQNWERALAHFKKLIAVEEYIAGKNLLGPAGLKAAAFDTVAYVYAGVAASQAKKEDEAVAFYRKIVDAGIDQPQYQEIYEQVLDYYKKKNDASMQTELLMKGKKAFPGANNWYQAEIEITEKTGGKRAVFATYEAQIKERDPQLAFFTLFNYAVELFRYVYNDKIPPDAAEKKNRLTELLEMAASIDSTQEANTLMARHLDYFSADLADELAAIKGSSVEDTQRKNDIKASIAAKRTAGAMYAKKVVDYYAGSKRTQLTEREKSGYKDVLDVMSRYAQAMGDVKMAQDYKDQKAKLNKL